MQVCAIKPVGRRELVENGQFLGKLTEYMMHILQNEGNLFSKKVENMRDNTFALGTVLTVKIAYDSISSFKQ